MKVAFVATDFPGLIFPYDIGGAASFVDQLTTLLQSRDVEITIVSANRERWPIEEKWQAIYRLRGIKIVYANPPRPSMPTYPVAWPLRISEQVTRAIQDTDIVYFQDWGGFGFDATSRARFRPGKRPCYVSVLHGASDWVRQGNKELASIPENLFMDFFERYMIEHSDFVASPSRFMLDWVKARGFILPPAERVRALGLPLLEPPRKPEDSNVAGARFKQVVFFGRLETRKGFEVFINALLLLARTQEDALQDLEQIVLLGHEAWNKIGSAEGAARILREAGLRTSCITDLDSKGAQQYLVEHTRDSLVVIPSLEDNYPYVVVEASLIDGLNLICSNTGGIPEILGSLGNAQLFRPCAQDLATKLAEWLRHGRVAADRLGQYDARAANQRWLAFHDEVSAYARGASFVRTPESVPKHRKKKSLDLCIPCFNHGRYLPQLLLSLEHQTRDDFNVIVIDDGSTDPESIRVFEAMRQKYSPRGWSFLHQENAFVDTARNTAVAHGTAEFISFLDADDIAALNLVERLLEAIHLSGDDCLMTCYCEFSEEEFPIDLKTGIRNTPCVAYKRPIGVDLVLSLADPDVLGSPAMIVRRSAYEAVGGFTEMDGAGHEDYKLYIKLEFAGFRVDVLAEPLQLKRAYENNLFSAMDKYLASMRIVRAYEERLREVNLEGLASAFLSLSREAELLRERVYKLERPNRAWQKLLMPLRHVRRVYIKPVFRKLRQIRNG